MNSKRSMRRDLRHLLQALAWLVILASLAACGGNTAGTTDETSTATTQPQSNATQAPEQEAKPEDAAASTLSPELIELFDIPSPGEYDAVRLGRMAEPITLKVVNQYTAGETSDLVDKGVTPDNCVWIDLIKDQLNIQLEYMWYVPSDQWKQRFQLSISSGEIPDILWMEEKEFRTFTSTDSLRDLTAAYADFAIPELHAMDAAFDGAPIKQSTVDGKLLGIPRYEDNHASVNLLYYRKDWAEKLGIAKPETIEDVASMAEAFGNQPDNPLANGIVANKEIFEEAHSLGGLFQSYGAYPGKWILKDGAVVPGTIQGETLTALQAMRDMYSKGALPKDFAGLSIDQASEMISSSNVGIVFAKWWTPAWPLNLNLQFDTSAQWELIPLPSHTPGAPALSSIEENMVKWYTGVYVGAPANAEEALVKLANYCFVRTFPVSDETWPQQPIPQTDEEHQALVAKDEARRNLGYVWNWTPVQVWNATDNSDRARIVNEALQNRDVSGLRNSGDKNWYDRSVLWLDKGLDDAKFYDNWGMYASRVMTDSGVLLSSRMRDEGHVTANVFYGGATETEEQVSSTLTDMSKEYMTKFILGEVGDDSWAGFVDEWLKTGGQDWWDEVVEGYNAIH